MPAQRPIPWQETRFLCLRDAATILGESERSVRRRVEASELRAAAGSSESRPRILTREGIRLADEVESGHSMREPGDELLTQSDLLKLDALERALGSRGGLLG